MKNRYVFKSFCIQLFSEKQTVFLNHLQLFIEYGKAARRQQDSSIVGQETPFQVFLILVLY